MAHIKKTLITMFWFLAAGTLLLVAVAFNIFMSLDQSGEPESADVIIVAEGNVPSRAYRGVELLQEGLADADKLIVSPATESNVPVYLSAGATEDQLIFEEQATSTWTNATNTIGIMEENGWDSAIVVTNDYHTRRTRLSFERAAQGKDLDFTYVSAYEHIDGEPIKYLDHAFGRKTGWRETAKYFGYMFGMYRYIDF